MEGSPRDFLVTGRMRVMRLGMRLNANRVARWIIHLGGAIERLASDGTTYPCPGEEYLRARHGSLLSAIADALEPV